GLANAVYPRETFDEETHAYLRGFTARSASALRLTKRLLYGMDGMSFEDAIARGAEVNVLARSTEDCRQGVRDFRARRGSYHRVLFRPDRNRRGPDPPLTHRMTLFAVGAILARAGVIWSRNMLIIPAGVILVAAIRLGLWGRKPPADADTDTDT